MSSRMGAPRNLLAPVDHPDAWVFITGPWAGLSLCEGAPVGDPTTGLPTAQPWTPRGRR